MHPETRAVYTPPIDMVSSHPDTMMTGMVESQRLTNSCGQAVTIFTNDQQLYNVAVNVMWVHPEQFVNFIPRLGGMHMLMSYIGAVETLMSNTGLEELMQSTFGGIPWALSLHICSQLRKDLATMRESERWAQGQYRHNA